MHPQQLLKTAADMTAFGGLPLRFSLADKPRIREMLTAFTHGARGNDNGDGFPAYVRRANAAGADVNDWIEQNLGWLPARPILEEIVFPHLSTNSTVCEVGVGTGRWSRHFLSKIPDGQLVLVDKSPWVVEFLRYYFRSSPNVEAHTCNGVELPFSRCAWADMIFSQGMFITLKLGHIYMYLREFSRALRPGGAAIFDFIDAETPEGWSFLEREMERAYDVFAYQSLSTISRACERAGLDVVESQTVGKSTYVIAKKFQAYR